MFARFCTVNCPLRRVHQSGQFGVFLWSPYWLRQALLPVLILDLYVAVQTIHAYAHPMGHSDDQHCALCLVVHASVMVVALPALPVLITRIVAAVPSVGAQQPRLTHSAPSFIRPPPAYN